MSTMTRDSTVKSRYVKSRYPRTRTGLSAVKPKPVHML